MRTKLFIGLLGLTSLIAAGCGLTDTASAVSGDVCTAMTSTAKCGTEYACANSGYAYYKTSSGLRYNCSSAGNCTSAATSLVNACN
ncbi:MAG: hypothetical protein WCI45_12420 [Desulfuromonadales bacterium]